MVSQYFTDIPKYYVGVEKYLGVGWIVPMQPEPGIGTREKQTQ